MSDCSSQKMTLDDAIAHLDDMITGAGLREGCLHEHEKLRGWLAELKNLMERHERLAQVARDLEELAHFAILHIENDLVIGPAVDRLVILRDKLRECGVSVDDRT